MEVTLFAVHVVLAFILIFLVLMQHGKGADAGAAFGSGASSTVFGSRGSGSFLTKLTTTIAVAFFATSLGLAYISAHKSEESSIIDAFEQQGSDPAVQDGLPPVGSTESGASEAVLSPTPADLPDIKE